MGIKRIVDTDFWTDDKVMTLFSPEDRLFMLYLMTNPHTTQLGVYKILPKQMAFELGYSLDTALVLLDRFESKYGIIKYSKETSEVAIKNYLKYSIVKGGKPVLDLLQREARAVKNKALLSYIKAGASSSTNETVLSFIGSIPDDDENENENDNDNDNEDSYHESVHDSSTNRKKQAKAPSRHKYGQYSNVLLSDDQLAKLKAEFPADWQERIERVSEYCASTGRSYKDYLATIRAWSKKDKQQAKPPVPVRRPYDNPTAHLTAKDHENDVEFPW